MSDVEHYFTRDPRVRSRPRTAWLALPGVELELATDAGVFAHGRIDRGTELLLRSIPSPPQRGDLLDLGCGYGAIALTVARRAPAARVWAVDVNRRALALTRQNAATARMTNIVAAEPDGVPEDVRFAAMYTNPPVRIGKEALHELLKAWLARLGDGAHAYLVVQRNLGSDSLARWLAEQSHTAERLRSRAGYRLLDVTPSAARGMIEP